MSDLSLLIEDERPSLLTRLKRDFVPLLVNSIIPIFLSLILLLLAGAVHLNRLPEKVIIAGKTIKPNTLAKQVNKLHLAGGVFLIGLTTWLGFWNSLDVLFLGVPIFLLAVTFMTLRQAEPNQMIAAEMSFYYMVIFVVCEISYYFWRVQNLEKVVEAGGGPPKKQLSQRVSANEREVGVQRAGESRKKKDAPVADNLSDAERQAKELEVLRNDFMGKKMRFSTVLLMIKNLAATIDRDEIFNNLMKILEKGLGATIAQLWLYDEKTQQLFVAATHGMKKSEADKLVIKPEDQNFIATSFREKVFLGVKQASSDPTKNALIGKGPVGSILTSPIIVDKNCIGVINISDMVNKEYESDETNLLNTTTDVSALVLRNARLLLATKEELQSAKLLSEDQLKEKEELKNAFGRYVSPKVIDHMMANPSALQLGGNRMPLTLFFSDVRGFTKMSETLEPEMIVNLLNEYFTEMCEILYWHEGTLDKFVGDELMALFGAPIPHVDDSLRAVFCAVYMQQAMQALQSKWESEGKPKMAIGIGVHRGDVVVGNIGSHSSMNYTAIGDVVNTAARIMSVAERNQTLISRGIFEEVKDYVEVKALEPVMVKGKAQPIEIFEVIGIIKQPDFTATSTDKGAAVAPKKDYQLAAGSGKKGEEAMGDLDVQKLIAQVNSGALGDNIKLEDLTKSNIQVTKAKAIECGNCKSENDPREKFCTKCGMPIF